MTQENNMHEKNVIIIGASHAGAQLALSLRQSGWSGGIQLIGNESFPPYHRPPLSKDFLIGNKQAEDLLIRPQALYEKNQIELLLDSEVLSINPQQKQLQVLINKQERIIAYEKLALCTGAQVRKLVLSGAELPGVHYLRNLADVEQIRASFPLHGNGKGVVIGGGYIGLETAAMLNKIGHHITVLEAAPQLLGRVAAKEIGDFYQALHRHHGVAVKTGVQIEKLSGDTRVKQVELADGTVLEVDFVIVGIGVLPNQALAEAAGLAVNNGILVNEFAQTSDKNIVAAGDCTRFEHPVYGEIRLESVPNATEQAKVAAATLCGKALSHHGLPWFWSDQYNCKLQIAGITQGYDEIVVRGSTAIIDGKAPSFCVFYFKSSRLLGVDCINRPKEFMLAKAWLQNGHTPEKTKLLDDEYPLGRDD